MDGGGAWRWAARTRYSAHCQAASHRAPALPIRTLEGTGSRCSQFFRAVLRTRSFLW